MSSDLIKEALSYQKQNNAFIKSALTYSGCTLGNINIIYYWFTSNNNAAVEKIKKDLNFPSTESVFESSWWSDKFIKQTLYKTGFQSFFDKILKELNDKGDSNSTLLYLGVNKICRTSRYPDYIDKKVYDEIDLRMLRIIAALYVLLYKVMMPGDKNKPDFYSKQFGINVKPPSTEKKSKLDSKDQLKFWKEIPPKLREKFECEEKEEIYHSYTYIKEQFEKFIISRYFERDDIYGRYDHALNVLMSRFKNGRFNFDDFWQLLATKYKNNSEIKDILLTEIIIKCPKTSSGNNLFIKTAGDFSDINNFEFSNVNFIDYENIQASIKYNINLPSRKIISQKAFTDPHSAACELNLSAGIITRANLVAYAASTWSGTAPYDDKYTAWIFLIQYIKANGPYNHVGCGSSSSSTSASSSSTLPAPLPSSTVPAKPTGGSTSTSSSGASTSGTTPPPPPPPSPGSKTTPTPAPPKPTSKPNICKAKLYDLGFINYCSEVIEPKELKEITEKLINAIQNLQFVQLAKEARRAEIIPNIIKKVDDVVDYGINLAPLFLGRK